MGPHPVRLLLCCLLPCVALANEPKRKAWVIGVDGARADVLEYLISNQSLPNIASITRQGQHAVCASVRSASCARAHTGPIASPEYEWVTAPGWGSVVTGVDTPKLGLKENSLPSMMAFKERVASHPTMFLEARKAGLTTAATGCPNFLSGQGRDWLRVGSLLDWCSHWGRVGHPLWCGRL